MERKLLAEQVARHLIDMVVQGQLKRGEQLPAERELATMLNVGRPAIREALRALHLLHIVEIRQGDGTYVTSLEPKLLIQPFEVFLNLGSLTRTHLYETRSALEVGITGLSAVRITPAEIRQLRDCNDEILGSLGDPVKFTLLDEEWHGIIFQSASNPLLDSVMESVVALHRMTRDWTARRLAVRRQAHHDHLQIIAALECHDSEASAGAMSRHLSNVWRLSAEDESGIAPTG